MFEKQLFIFLAIILVTIEKSQTQTSFTCVKDGLFAFNSCKQYYHCVNTNTDLEPHRSQIVTIARV